jgi:hypothetical protein
VDDYVTKPFSIRELLARVKAVLRPGTKRDRPPLAERHRLLWRWTTLILLSDSGKMIGRSTLRAISRTIVSENTPPTIERPIKSRKTMVGDRDAMGIAGQAVSVLKSIPQRRH